MNSVLRMNQMNNPYADERQANLYKNFPTNHFLSNPVNLDHAYLWNTFFRRNLHRLAIDYLGIKLHLYQVIILYLMGISRFFVIIACRAAAKSFIIALYACCRCITRPHSRIVLSSATKGQSKLIVSEKIQNELMRMSPMLQKEIKSIKNNQNEVIVYFRSNSTITVVPASENGRGYRSNCIIREEFRQIDKKIDDSILSPFQITRQAPYTTDEFYANMPEATEFPTDIYISSSWVDSGGEGRHWMWEIVDKAYKEMIKGEDSYLLAFDESITLKHKIKLMETLVSEKKKQDPLTWMVEFLNLRIRENAHAFFSYSLLNQSQIIKKPFYPKDDIEYRQRRKNPHDIPKQTGEIRVLSCDLAFVDNKKNDKSVYTLLRLLPESKARNDNSDSQIQQEYKIMVPYIESSMGGDVDRQAIRIQQLRKDMDIDYIVLDCRGGGILLYDRLAKVLYDESRDIEYKPLKCFNNESIANRIQIVGAEPIIYAVVANERLNSEIAITTLNAFRDKKVDLLINFNSAQEEVLPKITEYTTAIDADTQLFYEAPFLETQELINEMINLTYEKKPQTGVIVISEKSTARKDHYSSLSYGIYFATELERDLLSSSMEYEFGIFVN